MIALLHTELIATLAVSLTAALLLGVAARWMKLSPIVGYMLAGVLVGPHTPGFEADARLAEQLAEIGIALLMFGVGLHFSVEDLARVRRVAIPGAVGQSLVATLFGVFVGWSCGWSLTAGLVFGMALSVASTVVLVRGLTDHRQLHSIHGHVAIGWLVVEDLFTVLILVALPAMAGTEEASLWTNLAWTAAKVAALVGIYIVGVRIVPCFLLQVARLQSRELFTLAVLGMALGVAYGAAAALSVSMALGAFLSGMIVGRSEMSHQAAADAMPLRDAFAVLFFVGVGMLFDPGFVLERPFLVLSTIAIVLVIKPAVALVITLICGFPIRTGLTVGAGLAQIGEFSFIVAALGQSLGLLPADAAQAVVAAALVSIAANPVAMHSIAPLERLLRRSARVARWTADKAGMLAYVEKAQDARPSEHVVLCGNGRTGGVVVEMLRANGWAHVTIEQDRARVVELREQGVPAIHGDAANDWTLERAGVATAKLVVITIPDPIAVHQIVESVRRHAPMVPIVSRVQSKAEELELGKLQVSGVFAETELAIEISRRVMQSFGIGPLEAQARSHDLRRGRAGTRSGARVLEVQIQSDSRSAGLRLADLGLGKGMLVMAIERDGAFLVPDGQTRLEPGDRVSVIAAEEVGDLAQQRF